MDGFLLQDCVKLASHGPVTRALPWRASRTKKNLLLVAGIFPAWGSSGHEKEAVVLRRRQVADPGFRKPGSAHLYHPA